MRLCSSLFQGSVLGQLALPWSTHSSALNQKTDGVYKKCPEKFPLFFFSPQRQGNLTSVQSIALTNGYLYQQESLFLSTIWNRNCQTLEWIRIIWGVICFPQVVSLWLAKNKHIKHLVGNYSWDKNAPQARKARSVALAGRTGFFVELRWIVTYVITWFV